MRLSVTTPPLVLEFEPQIRVYNPQAKGLVAEGLQNIDLRLTDSGSYLVTIHNANRGLGGPEYTYELTTSITP